MRQAAGDAAVRVEKFTMVQHNVGGAFEGSEQSDWMTFTDFLDNLPPHVKLVALQETFRQDPTPPAMVSSGWQWFASIRHWAPNLRRGGGGVAILVRNGVSATALSTANFSADTEYPDAVTVHVTTDGGTCMVVTSLYVPPESTPEGRAAWQQAERHVMELHARVKAGAYGIDAQHSELAILGDLNARCGSGPQSAFANLRSSAGEPSAVVGWVSADTKPPSARGKLLASVCNMTELLPANAINIRKRASYTNEWKNAQGMSRTVIDYVLLSGRLWQAVVECDAHGNDPVVPHVADKLVSGCNGHRMLFTMLEFVVADNSVPSGGQRDRGGRPPDWKTLSEDAINRYAQRCHAAVQRVFDANPNVEFTVGELSVIIDDAARKELSRSAARRQIHVEAAAIRQQIRCLKTAKKRATDNAASREQRMAAMAECMHLRRELKRMTNAENEERYAVIRRSIMNVGRNNAKQAWALLNSVLGKGRARQPIPALRKPDGTLAVDMKERQALLRKHFARIALAPDINDPEFDVQHAKYIAERCAAIVAELAERRADSESEDNLDAPFKLSDLLKEVKAMPRHKAADMCGHQDEHIKELLRAYDAAIDNVDGDAEDTEERLGRQYPALKAWLGAFNDIFATGITPKAWLQARVEAIFKPGGDKADAGSYRGVTITNRLASALDRMILTRLQPFCIKRGMLGDSQFGFLKKKSTEQAVATLTMTLEARVMSGRTADGRTVYAAFLDVAKAFESVHREALIVRLYDNGVRGNLLRYISASSLLATSKAVSCNDASLDESSKFTETSGVCQGSVLAPFAFLLQGSANLIAALQLYHDDCGVTTRTGARIWSLSYADDIVLLATTKTGLQRMLDAAAGEMRRARMRFNPKKCKVVVFRGRNDPPPDAEVYLGETCLEVVPSFRYLGVELDQHILTPARVGVHPTQGAVVEAKMRRRAGIVYTASRSKALTPIECRQLYLSQQLTCAEYCCGITVRGVWPEVERLQLAAARVIIGLPSNCQSNAVCLNGEMGWWSADGRFAMGAIRLFRAIHDTAPTEPLRVAYEYYKSCCADAGHPDGTWTRRVLNILDSIGFLDVFHKGWPRGEHGGVRVPSDKQLIHTWQTDLWRRSLATHSSLETYAALHTQLEPVAYLRSTNASYRRTMFRLRTGYGPWAVNPAHRARMRADDANCPHCAAAGLQREQDVPHVLTGCVRYAGQQATINAAIHQHMDGRVLEWANDADITAERYTLLALGGEIPDRDAVGPGYSHTTIQEGRSAASMSRQSALQARNDLAAAIYNTLMVIGADCAQLAGYKDGL